MTAPRRNWGYKQGMLRHARANTIYELADPYNATINVYVKLCHQSTQCMYVCQVR